MSHRRLTGLALAVTAGLASVALGSPAHAEQAQPDLRTTVAFNQDTGKVGDALTVTVTVSNNGTGTAEDVTVVREWEDSLAWTSPALADGAEFDLAAGESKVLTRTGTIPDAAAADGFVQVLYYFAAANEDKNTHDNIGTRIIRVPGQVGEYTIRVVDAETKAGVAGAVVEFTEITHSPGNFSARVVSDAAGNAELKGAQVGQYNVSVTPPAGWKATAGSRASIFVQTKPDDLTLKFERNGEPTAEPSLPAPSASAGGVQPGATVSPSGSASGEAPLAGESTRDVGLPITGSNATVVVVAGLGLLVAGAVAFLLARQRRTRFTSSS